MFVYVLIASPNNYSSSCEVKQMARIGGELLCRCAPMEVQQLNKVRAQHDSYSCDCGASTCTRSGLFTFVLFLANCPPSCDSLS